MSEIKQEEEFSKPKFESAVFFVQDIDQKLEDNDVKLIHPIIEAPWGQKAFRAYDPDNHIIEFGEPMTAVVIRLHQKGMSPEEIIQKTTMPIEIVNQILANI